MARAPFQVIVIPYRLDSARQLRYLVFKRSDSALWQWIAGGGEGDETPEQAARREAFEEARIDHDAALILLDSITSIPVIHFSEHRRWDKNRHVIPEYSFGIEVESPVIHLSKEHLALRLAGLRNGAEEPEMGQQPDCFMGVKPAFVGGAAVIRSFSTMRVVSMAEIRLLTPPNPTG